MSTPNVQTVWIVYARRSVAPTEIVAVARTRDEALDVVRATAEFEARVGCNSTRLDMVEAALGLNYIISGPAGPLLRLQ